MKKDKRYDIQIPSQVLVNSLKNTIKNVNKEEGSNYPVDPDQYELKKVSEKFFKQFECRFVEKKTSKIITVKIKVHN